MSICEKGNKLARAARTSYDDFQPMGTKKRFQRSVTVAIDWWTATRKAWVLREWSVGTVNVCAVYSHLTSQLTSFRNAFHPNEICSLEKPLINLIGKLVSLHRRWERWEFYTQKTINPADFFRSTATDSLSVENLMLLTSKQLAQSLREEQYKTCRH